MKSNLGKQRPLGCQCIFPSAIGVALVSCIQDWVAACQHEPTVQEFEPGAAAFPAIPPNIAQDVGKIAMQLAP